MRFIRPRSPRDNGRHLNRRWWWVAAVVAGVIAAAVTVPLTLGHSSSPAPVPAEYTCGGCPRAESGAALAADLRVAKAVNLNVSELPPGSQQVAPPGPASADTAFGVVAPQAAMEFSACMGLDASQQAAISTNADQVLNVGSPTFSDPADHLQVSSWVDMVKTASDGASDWSIYGSTRYSSCAGGLYKGLFSAEAKSANKQVGPLAVSVTALPMPAVASGHRLLLDLKAGATSPASSGASSASWMALMQDGRVEATLVLSPQPEMTASTIEPLALTLTATMLEHAESAQKD